MKYYKLLTALDFIGIASSSEFKRINPINGWLLTSDENQGQFISINNKLYRDFWMQPISDVSLSYENVNVREITQEEYDTIRKAMQREEEIIIDDDDEEEEVIPVAPSAEELDLMLEYVRNAKIKEMSAACRAAIENGFDIVLSDGESHHFSLTTQDQLNLMALSNITDDVIPYHADGEFTQFFSAADIKAIIDGALKHKTYQTTYYNSLRNYINSLSTIEEISEITYGIAIPEEYKSDVLKVLE